MALHQDFDGLTLAGAGIAEAQPALKQVPDRELIHHQLRIATLGIADDEQAVVLLQLCQRLLHAGEGDVAGILLQEPVLLLHAGLKYLVPLRHGDGNQHDVSNLRHGLAEQAFQVVGGDEQILPADGGQMVVIAVGHDLAGIPEGAVDVKYQCRAFHGFPP